MSSNLPIRIRPAIQEDVPFIFNSWLKSFRHSHIGRLVTNEIYFNSQHKIIEKILQENTVMVACNQEDPSQLYGYIVAGDVEGHFILHYVYIKHTYRNMGLAKTLLNTFSHDPSTASVYTHHTRVAEKLASKYNFVFHPYLLFNMKESNNEQSE